MKRLETVYLANVILYIDTIETIVKLIQVNKKCQDAGKMIRYYKPRKLYENDKEYYLNYVVINNLFEIFPNIETIRCNDFNILNNLELFEKVKQIELDVTYGFSGTMFSQEIKEKIIRIYFLVDFLKNTQINQFPNVKKVDAECTQECYFKDFLGNTNVKLNQLIIRTKDSKELDCLKSYCNIENIIIFIKDKLLKERYLELKQFANVYSPFPIGGIDVKESLRPITKINLSNEYDINKLYDLTLFTKCFVENDCDLKNYELLEEIDTRFYNKNKSKIQIEGLHNLKSIKGIRNVDCFPSSVTCLYFNKLFNWKELIEKDVNCFSNVKKINYYNEWNGGFDDSKLFLNFRNCTKIELFIGGHVGDPLEFPTTVRELIIGEIQDVNQIKEISKLTGLKHLSIEFNVEKNNNFYIQEMFDNLKELEKLESNFLEEITLPSTVSYLESSLWVNKNIAHHTNLKEIGIYCHVDNGEVVLPNKLKKLYLYGKVIVTNSNEIEVDEIIFDNTPSQFCKWKTNKIFIERSYEEKNLDLL